jgi:predicted dienelactone hydrolase
MNFDRGCARWRSLVPAVGLLLVAFHETVAQAEDSMISPFNAGLAEFSVIDPVEGGAMRAIVVYPTEVPAGIARKGSYDIEAAEGAQPARGAFPLVLVSHGTGGSQLGHHDSLTYFARHGFVAAAVMHPRDNFLDTSGFGTDLQYKGRPLHICALLDAVLADPAHGAIVDKGRIGIMGFSAGGYTALVLIGGQPDMGKFADYCREQPDDRMMCGSGGPRNLRPDLNYAHDPRIKAAVLMAPALGFVFNRASLANVRVPVRIYRPTEDALLRHPYNAERIREVLPAPPEYVALEGAGHYVFLAPCPEALRRIAPGICNDPNGIDRRALHARFNAEMVAFFDRALPGQ